MLAIESVVCVILVCGGQIAAPLVHNAYSPPMYQLKGTLPTAETELQELVRAGRWSEFGPFLKRWEGRFPADESARLVGMGTLLRRIAQISIESGVERTRTPAFLDPEIRKACAPFADSILDRELPCPAAPQLLDAQLSLLTSFGKPLPAEKDETSRLRFVRRLVRIWSRVVQSCRFHAEEFSANVVAGESPSPKIERPNIPAGAVDGFFASGMSPDAIKDPAVRKRFVAYLDATRQLSARLSTARETSRLRTFRLSTLRKQLEVLYGEDRAKWKELQTVVADEVPDQTLSKFILIDLTYRKDPDIWP